MTLLRLLLGGGLPEQLRRAYEARLTAQNDAARLTAERDVERISAAIEMARISAADRWGATSLGRYLIMLPYGLWWAAVHLDSILDAPWSVLALPPQIHGMAQILIPAIIIADGAALAARRWQ